VKENALEDMIEAGKEEAAIAIESGEIDADGIPMIPVIVDGASVLINPTTTHLQVLPV
jgi:hypothetical protein